MADPKQVRHLSIFAELLERARNKNPAPPAALARIPVEIYFSEERLERERREVFSTRPLAIGHTSQIPKPGDAIVHDWTGLPLVTLRDKTGRIGTVMNVCRHRNTRLVQDAGVTELRAFVCPYHRWSYGLDGRLKGIPRESGFLDLDRSELDLVRLPTQVRHGLIWIQLNRERPMDLDAHLASLDADFEAFEVGRSSFYRQSVRHITCNWKLIQDAFLDAYHVVRLHKDTVGRYFTDGLAVTEVDGEHIRSAVARKGAFEALDTPRSEWNLRELATFSYTVFPNSVFVMHPDYTSHIALYPTSPDETIFVHSMLTLTPPRDEPQRERYDRSFALIDGGVFGAEDIAVSEAAQRGMRSGANRELLAGADEVGLHRFHEILDAALAG